MLRFGHRIVALVVIVAALGVAAPARAEWFADLYLGWGITGSSDVTFTTRTPRTFEDVELDNSLVWGGRAGYWFGPDLLGPALGGRFLGADVDLSYFRPRIAGQTVDTEVGQRRLGAMDISVVTITPELVARYPLLADKEFPAGRMQPYAAIGPTIFFSSATDSGTFGGRGDEESDAGVGVALRGGLAWHVTDAVAIFAEYRLVRVSPEYEFRRGPVDLGITGHQLNFGVSYRFGP